MTGSGKHSDMHLAMHPGMHTGLEGTPMTATVADTGMTGRRDNMGDTGMTGHRDHHMGTGTAGGLGAGAAGLAAHEKNKHDENKFDRDTRDTLTHGSMTSGSGMANPLSQTTRGTGQHMGSDTGATLGPDAAAHSGREFNMFEAGKTGSQMPTSTTTGTTGNQSTFGTTGGLSDESRIQRSDLDDLLTKRETQHNEFATPPTAAAQTMAQRPGVQRSNSCRSGANTPGHMSGTATPPVY